MKKQYIIIGCLILAVALLVGGYFIITGNAPEPDEEQDDTINIAITGYKMDEVRDDVELLTLQTPYGLMHFTPKPGEDGYSSAKWYVQEMANAESETWAVNDIATAF